MAEQALAAFVKEALTTGRSRPEVRQALVAAGWAEDQADDALSRFAEVDFPIPVPRPQADGAAREAFLYIVYFALLGAVSTSVGALAFAFVDARFLDALSLSAGSASGLRWQVAWLIVGFPIFMFLGARLAATRSRDPNRRASRVKAWLTYVTLIFAALTLIGDFVAIVFRFLDGEMTMRFLSKATIVGVIAGAILFVYSRDAERRVAGGDLPGRIVAIAASVLTALLVAWAFTVVRSPGAARDERADDRRLADVETIVRIADCHASYFGALPEAIPAGAEELGRKAAAEPITPGCALSAPTDPATGEWYEYRRAGETGFEVCAFFDRGWPDGRGPAKETRANLRDPRLAAAGERSIELPTSPGRRCYVFEAAEVREIVGTE